MFKISDNNKFIAKFVAVRIILPIAAMAVTFHVLKKMEENDPIED